MLPTLGPSKAIFLLKWPSLTKDMQTEQPLCWSGMTDTEQTTSGSNEKESNFCICRYLVDN